MNQNESIPKITRNNTNIETEEKTTSPDDRNPDDNHINASPNSDS